MSRELIEQGLRWRWTPLRVRGAISDPATDVIVIREGSSLAGFAVMQYGDLHAHLGLLAVMPAQRGRGLGTQLLSWLESCADHAGIRCICLEARSDNQGAMTFYQKRGYQPIRVSARYYDGLIDAVHLEKALWPLAAEHIRS